MTRAELRSTLEAFRLMVRNRGPREAMEVAAVDEFSVPFETATNWTFRSIMPRLAARAVLRWWRWANRQDRWVAVREFDWECEGVNVWTSG